MGTGTRITPGPREVQQEQLERPLSLLRCSSMRLASHSSNVFDSCWKNARYPAAAAMTGVRSGTSWCWRRSLAKRESKSFNMKVDSAGYLVLHRSDRAWLLTLRTGETVKGWKASRTVIWSVDIALKLRVIPSFSWPPLHRHLWNRSVSFSSVESRPPTDILALTRGIFSVPRSAMETAVQCCAVSTKVTSYSS